jgi:hypothetical protein
MKSRPRPAKRSAENAERGVQLDLSGYTPFLPSAGKPMIVAKGEKIHVVYRALYENSTRRHFLGQLAEVDGTLCRVVGYAFIFDRKSETFVRRPERRTTILDLAESGYIVNVIDPAVELDKVSYRYLSDVGLALTDGQSFVLNVNEFGSKS